MKILTITILFTYMLGAGVLKAQFSFEERDSLSPNPSRNSGLPLGIVDMNGDLLDDIVFLDKGSNLHVAYQSWNGEFEEVFLFDLGPHDQWSMVVGDIDRNGWNDIVVAGSYDNIKVVYQEGGQYTLTEIQKPLLFAQAMNLVDIDTDGYLDLFVCNDIGYNLVMWNDGGTFVNDTTNLFKDLTKNESKGNYGSEWIDVDNDGDYDLHISKCFAGVDDAGDPRRVNRLYINQGNSVFSEEGTARGLANGAQSWTGHWFDSDADGDFDVLITNHDRTAQLFINDGKGYFSEFTVESGLNIGGPVIQSLTSDFDMDGYQDIIIGGFPDFLYQNHGDNQYSGLTPPGLYDMTTLSIGDLNNDHYPDVYSAHLGLINIPTSRKDKIFLNEEKKANHLVVYLQSDSSPANGIGAKVRFYESGRSSVHAIRSGESYGIQTTFKVMYGLAERTSIDSIIVTWPSGVVQRLTQVEANRWVVFHEAGHIIVQDENALPDQVTLCEGDTIALTGPDNYRYLWKNLDTNQVVSISSAGFYQLDLKTDDGIQIRLPGTTVQEYDFNNRGIKILEGDTMNCKDSDVILTYDHASEVNWNNSERAQQFTVNHPTWIGGTVETQCGVEELDSIYIGFLDVEGPEVIENLGAKKGDTAKVLTNQLVNWYSSANGGNILHTGDEMVVPQLEKDTTFYISSIDSFTFKTFELGEKEVKARNPYHDDNLNGTMLFKVETPISLESVDVFTDYQGIRTILLLDGVGIIDSQSVFCDSGWTTVPLNFDLIPEDGVYRLTTDDKVNRISFGTRSPQLMSSDSAVTYPYELKDMVTLINAQYGFGTYNYFYRWVFQPAPLICESERKEVRMEVKISTSVSDQDDRIDIFPNPSTGTFKLFADQPVKEIRCYTATGIELPLEFYPLGQPSVYHVRVNAVGVILLKVNGQIRKVVIEE